MFGKRERPAKANIGINKVDFRAHDRRFVQGLTAYIDQQEVEIYDYSDGGIRVVSRHELPRVAVIEIFKGKKLVKSVASVRAWARHGQAGYAFRPKLKLSEVASSANKAYKSIPAQVNKSGGIAGSALRDRLKL